MRRARSYPCSWSMTQTRAASMHRTPPREEPIAYQDPGTWFARTTTLSSAWPVERLLEAKGGQRISVVIPARDEAATIGSIIRALRAELVERWPLWTS